MHASYRQVIILFFFHVSINAMEQSCQFVPVMNEVEIQNGPIVALSVAKQSALFFNMLEDTCPAQEIISFRLPNCNKKTAKLFAAYLTKLHEITDNDTKQSLISDIKHLSPKQKIRLCNIAEYALVQSLTDCIYNELADDSIDKNLLSHLNPDARKKIASSFIAKNKCDVTLLQAYSEQLRTKEHLLEREGWLLRPFLKTSQICYLIVILILL